MKDFEKLAERMRADWDRRVAHDYRFWMSDGTSDDSAMWEAGERDYQIVLDGCAKGPDRTLFELGCGVGRLLRPALQDYGHVIGLDVSKEAIGKARDLLPDLKHLELIVGNGFDLREIDSSSVDVAVSFAAITSMPRDVIANYLIELHRILKARGVVRLQLYLGEEQKVSSTDTLHLRCFKRECFEEGVKKAGFDVQFVTELKLPFQVSFKEIGIEAFVVSLEKSERKPDSVKEIADALQPAGETDFVDGDAVTPIEFWMSYNFAKELIKSGDLDRAKKAVEFASNVCKTAAIDVSDLLAEIIGKLEELEASKSANTSAPIEDTTNSTSKNQAPVEQNFYFENEKILQQKFSNIASKINPEIFAKDSGVEAKNTKEGLALFYQGQCLDHPDKPIAAAEVWAKRLLQEERMKEAKHIVVYGFGAAYHIEALIAAAPDKKISAIEATTVVFSKAMEVRDLSNVLDKLHGLVIGEKDPNELFIEGTEIAFRPQSQAISGQFTNTVKSKFYGARGIDTLHPRVAILGPLQGGTLPMTNYVSRAFGVINQRYREINMGGFGAGYHEFDGIVKDKMRRHILQGKYLEMLSNAVLESISEKEIDILVCMAQAPITAEVLLELRKRGVITVLWFVEDYLRFNYWQEMAQYFDFIFTIQKGQCIEAIKAAGAGHVEYLPVACDPGIHIPLELSDEDRERWGSPVSFVGAGYHNRQQLFASLSQLPIKIWGTEWPDCKPFDRMVQEGGRRLTPEEYVKIFNATDININLHSSSERDGVDPYGDFVNPRTLELASCGAFQLCDPRSMLPELLEPGKEIVLFENANDLKEKVTYYLAHPEEREIIVKAARKKVASEHTYAHRMKELLSIVYSKKYEHIKARMGVSPWKRMLERSKPYPELHDRCQQAFDRGEEANLDGLIADIYAGGGKLSETEQKLLFLYHIRKQIIRKKAQDEGEDV